MEDALGLSVMILGLVLFLGVHLLTTQRDLRARFVASLGEGGYKLGYTVVSLAGLALVVWGFSEYRAAGMIPVWPPPAAFKHFASIIIVGSCLAGAVFARISLKRRAAAGAPPIPVGGPVNDFIAVAVGI